MTPEDQAWQKLVQSARQVRDERDLTAPFGFSTRIVSRALASTESSLASVFERFSWKALSLAGLLAVSSVAANYAWVAAPSEDDVLSDQNLVAALFDPSS